MSKKTILKAADIQAKWAKEAKGEVWLPTDTIFAQEGQIKELVSQNTAYEKQLEQMTRRLDQSTGGTASLKAHLDTILKKWGIQAAFEPLIEMATALYPADYPIETLRGEFKLNADQRIKVWTEILSYQLPKLKAMEVSGTVDSSITVVVRRFGGDAVIERDVTPPVVQKIVDVEAKSEGPDVKVKKF